MNAKTSLVLASAAALAAIVLAGCATGDPKPAAVPSAANPASQIADSPAATAVARLKKNLSAADLRALLGAPVSITPIVVGEAKGENWSYAFTGATTTRMVPVGTQELPAVNPLTGREITRTETIYQNQDVRVIDTLHLLLFDGRLIEWKVVRDEKKQFQ